MGGGSTTMLTNFKPIRSIVLLISVAILTACGGSGGSNSSVDGVTTTANFDVSGSVGDGPVTNAEVTFYDRFDNLIGSTYSDSSARYNFTIPPNTALPLTVRASGGFDLVTGRALDFTLVSRVPDTTSANINVSPITTLQSHTETCVGEQDAYTRSKKVVSQLASMGLDQFDSQLAVIDESNIAPFVKSNEALGEVIRRVADLSNNTDANAVIRQFGCDLADGSINGSGDSDPRMAALLHSTIATVLVETVLDELQVNGADASELMNNAISTVLPSADQRTEDVAVSTAMVEQIQTSLGAVQSVVDDTQIETILTQLEQTSPQQMATMLRSFGGIATFKQLVPMTMQLDNIAIQTIATAATEDSPQPEVAFASNKSIVAPGTSVTLRWSSVYAAECKATHDKLESVLLAGTITTEAITDDTEFGIECSGPGGSTSEFVNIVVAEDAGQIGDPIQTIPAPVADAPTTTPIQAPVVDAPTPAPTPIQAPVVVTPTPAPTPTPIQAPVVVAPTPAPTPTPIQAPVVVAPTPAPTPTPIQAPVVVAPTPPPTPTPIQAPVVVAPTPAPNPAPIAVEPTPVAPTPAPEVTLELSAAQTWVPRSGSTTITWSSVGADNCVASQAWDGQRPTSGSFNTGSLTRDQTFSLSCSNGAHNSVAIVTVRVRQARFTWAAPTTNIDGSALTNLAGHRIHWGTSPGVYSSSVDIDNTQQTSYVLELPPGLYYFNVTSINQAEVQSPYSLERSKEIK